MGKDEGKGKAAKKASARQRKRKPASARFSRQPKAKEAMKGKKSRSRVEIQEARENAEVHGLDELSLTHKTYVHDQRGKALPGVYHGNRHAALTMGDIPSSEFLGFEGSCGVGCGFGHDARYEVDVALLFEEAVRDQSMADVRSFVALRPVVKNEKLEGGGLPDSPILKTELEHENETVRWEQASYCPWEGGVKSEAEFENRHPHTAFSETPEEIVEVLLSPEQIQHIEMMTEGKTALKTEDQHHESVADNNSTTEDLDFGKSFEIARGCFEQSIKEWDERDVSCNTAVKKSSLSDPGLDRCQTFPDDGDGDECVIQGTEVDMHIDVRRLLDENLQLKITLDVALLGT